MGIHYNIQLDLSFSIDWIYFVVVYNCDLICNTEYIETTTRKKETMTTDQELEYLLKTIKENNKKIAEKHKQIRKQLEELEKQINY